jgi:hypothetical protein
MTSGQRIMGRLTDEMRRAATNLIDALAERQRAQAHGTFADPELVAQAVVVGGSVSGTPQFFGTQPARVQHGTQADFRGLPHEEDFARQLEYDNTQEHANHVHSVWRDLGHDWGGDLLSSHYRRQHHAPHLSGGGAGPD